MKQAVYRYIENWSLGIINYYFSLTYAFFLTNPPKRKQFFKFWLYTLPVKLWNKPCIHTGETFSQYLLRSGVNIPTAFMNQRLIVVLVLLIWPIIALKIIWKHKGCRWSQFRFAIQRPDLYAVFPSYKFNHQAISERRSDILSAIFNAYHFYIHQSEDYSIEDKNIFLKKMADFGLPHFPIIQWEDACKTEKDFIIKQPLMDMGLGIERISASDLRKNNTKPVGIIQNIFENHQELMVYLPLTPPLCTLRILTGSKKKTFDVYTAYFRIGSSGKVVDNLSLGGLLVELDKETGEMLWGITPEMMKGKHKLEKLLKHPKAQKAFAGQKIPYFEKAIALCLNAHEHVVPNLQSVGWDVAICHEGLFLVEANVFSGTYEIFNFNNLYSKSLEEMSEKLFEK